MMSILRRKLLLLFIFSAASLVAEGSPPITGPLIMRLDGTDVTFAQYLADVQEARGRLASPAVDVGAEAVAALAVYSYRTTPSDGLFALAARCNVPYDTIATANRLDAAELLGAGRTLILSSTPGLFIPERPASDLERLLAASRADVPGWTVVLRTADGESRFRFLPGADFTPTERAFFLNAAFRYPLPAGTVTSSFGIRRNPFSGHVKFHEGVDLAARVGTEVYATRNGTVAAVGEDPVYGRYIILEHEGGWRSFYGHLSATLADLRKPVRSGTIIGRVGTTGQSTGPHLHFELRRNGEARDPASLLPRGMQR
jgi:murein DD-endopeptidase MepM/ murein hydrolase activator NlpD